MSYSQQIYLGPYAECKVGKKTVRVRDKVKVCPNETCPALRVEDEAAVFCKRCGQKLDWRDDIHRPRQEDAVSPGDVVEEMKEALTAIDIGKDGTHVYVSNDSHWLRDREAWLSYNNDPGLVSIRDIDYGFEVGEFGLHFKDALAVLEKHYGKDNVRLGWGLLLFTL